MFGLQYIHLLQVRISVGIRQEFSSLVISVDIGTHIEVADGIVDRASATPQVARSIVRAGNLADGPLS